MIFNQEIDFPFRFCANRMTNLFLLCQPRSLFCLVIRYFTKQNEMDRLSHRFVSKYNVNIKNISVRVNAAKDQILLWHGFDKSNCEKHGIITIIWCFCFFQIRKKDPDPMDAQKMYWISQYEGSAIFNFNIRCWKAEIAPHICINISKPVSHNMLRNILNQMLNKRLSTVIR